MLWQMTATEDCRMPRFCPCLRLLSAGPVLEYTMESTVEVPCGHGGKRRGAGRPQAQSSRCPHRARPACGHVPVHVTLVFKAEIPNLRCMDLYPVIEEAMFRASDRFGCRIIAFTVMTDHIHMVGEAEGDKSLSKAMNGLNCRIARGLNKALGRRGTVLHERYHAVYMKTRSHVRNTLRYVLLNARKHGFHYPAGHIERSTIAIERTGRQTTRR